MAPHGEQLEVTPTDGFSAPGRRYLSLSPVIALAPGGIQHSAGKPFATAAKWNLLTLIVFIQLGVETRAAVIHAELSVVREEKAWIRTLRENPGIA